MKKREINRWIKERKDSQGRLLCLVPTCNELREKYKTSNRTRNYCKRHTFRDIWEFTNWSVLRIKALKRDNYACVKCGRKKDTSELIGDHIIPIALGGDEWDLNNIQTLCIKCNKIKTAQDAKDIAKQRRKEKVILKNRIRILNKL